MRWNILRLLNRNGESRRSGGRKRRWFQARVNSQLHQNVLHVRSHHIGRHRQFGSHLLDAAPEGEKLEYPLLLLG